MPVYTYEARDEQHACDHCRAGFEVVQRLSEKPVETCPRCGGTVRKCFPRVALGRSRSSLDQRAKSAGFSKLKKIGRGEYEKQY